MFELQLTCLIYHCSPANLCWSRDTKRAPTLAESLALLRNLFTTCSAGMVSRGGSPSGPFPAARYVKRVLFLVLSGGTRRRLLLAQLHEVRAKVKGLEARHLVQEKSDGVAGVQYRVPKELPAEIYR